MIFFVFENLQNAALPQRAPVTAALQPGRDIDWAEFVRGARPAPCVPLDSNDLLYVLYTSGTTGDPKGTRHDICVCSAVVVVCVALSALITESK